MLLKVIVMFMSYLTTNIACIYSNVYTLKHIGKKQHLKSKKEQKEQ